MKVHIDSFTFRFDGICGDCGEDTGQIVSVTIGALQEGGWPQCEKCETDLLPDHMIDIIVPEKTLVIEGVDLDLLDKQRLRMLNVDSKCPEGKAKEALRGIQGMLDSWSDKRHFDKCKPYESIEEKLAEVMTAGMSTAEMTKACYHDVLNTLNDCTEDEILEFENKYLGKKDGTKSKQ